MKKIKSSMGLIWFATRLFLVMGLVVVNGCGKKEEKPMKNDEALFGRESKENAAEITPLEKGGQKMVVSKGDKVKVEYVGSLENGTVFDRSKEANPLLFSVGSRQVIPGFEQAVEGMKLNEEKKVNIKVEDAYGPRREKLVRDLPRASLPENLQAEKGKILRLKTEEGRIVMGKIVDIKEDNLVVDFNHPLAGKNLVFELKVVGIE